MKSKKNKNLNRYQKSLLLFMIVMMLVFAVVYPNVISKVGFEYKDNILIPSEENGNTRYSGIINGKQAYFMVSEDKTVEFHYGNIVYGPYTAVKDSSAIPEGEVGKPMTGVELRKGNEILFRGGVYDAGDFYLFYDEDGTLNSSSMVTVVSNEDVIITDGKGNRIDPMEPTAAILLDLMYEPELTHKGDSFAWYAGAFICIINAILILFADELFYLKMSFRVQNVEDIIPSGLEMVGRYVGWVILIVMALSIFVIGLQ